MPEASWWYLKKRVNPAGVLGRPRSSVPLKERHKRAREKYRAKLAARGVSVVRLPMKAADANLLRARAKQSNLSPGELVGQLLRALSADTASNCPAFASIPA